MDGHSEMESTLNQLLVEMDGKVVSDCIMVATDCLLYVQESTRWKELL